MTDLPPGMLLTDLEPTDPELELERELEQADMEIDIQRNDV